MNNQEQDRNPNNVSNQDMREFETSENRIKDSDGSLDLDIEPSGTKDDDSNSGNQTVDEKSAF